MEIKTKELMTASYKVACVSGDYSIEGNVTLGSNNEVTTLDSCIIQKSGTFVAGFSLYNKNLNVNYASNIDLTEQGIVLGLIDEFKQVSTNN